MSASTSGFYSSIEPDVLGVTLRYATKSTVSDYLHQKVWEQIGAESDASWMIDAQGFEVAHTHFNAVLRDYARLGRLFAHDGAWEGRQIIPERWMIDATTTRASDHILHRAEPVHSHLVWLLDLAASWIEAPICALERLRPAPCRSEFEAHYGADSGRDEAGRGHEPVVGSR